MEIDGGGRQKGLQFQIRMEEFHSKFVQIVTVTIVFFEDI